MVFNNDIYQLKITFLNGNKNQPYRVIEIEKYQNLTNLADTILSSFNLGNGHCFGFFNNLKTWTNSTIRYEQFVDLKDMQYGLSEYAKSPNKTTVEKAFTETPTLLFLYDYGAEFLFIVKLVEQVELVNLVKYPRTIKSAGKISKQYLD